MVPEPQASPTAPRRVLIVAKGPPDSGGISAFVQSLLASPVADRFEISFLNLTRAESSPAGRASWANVRRTMADAAAVWRAARAADVVHIHSALVPLVTMLRAASFALASRLRGAAVLLHVHNGLVEPWLADRPAFLVRLLLAPAHLVAACSQGSRDALATRVGPDRVVLVDNGVDVARFAPSRREASTRPLVLFAGSLTPRKGLLDLFEASRLLRSRGLQHRVRVVGGPPDEGPAAEAEVRAAAAADGIEVSGARPHDEMPEIYGGADVFCLPSWWEAMPLVVLEAMAAGLPIVATDVGDTARAVRHEVSGLLVPAREPEALAGALERVLRDEELRRELGAAARAGVVADWNSTATWREVARLYDRVHRAGGRASGLRRRAG